jgi:hypothetical protein
MAEELQRATRGGVGEGEVQRQGRQQRLQSAKGEKLLVLVVEEFQGATKSFGPRVPTPLARSCITSSCRSRGS